MRMSTFAQGRARAPRWRRRRADDAGRDCSANAAPRDSVVRTCRLATGYATGKFASTRRGYRSVLSVNTVSSLLKLWFWALLLFHQQHLL